MSALAGILTPQANATVESEMRALLPPELAWIVARLTCPSPDSRERLLQYFRNVHATVAQFDTAPVSIAGFACTGSTYLVGLDEEARLFSQSRVPIVSAGASVLQALRALKATRIALLSPYPEWLTRACVAFWRSHGVEVTAVAAPPGERSDTRRIYTLTAADAAAGLERLDTAKAHVALVSGTGMASLQAIARASCPVPVLSSNLCLAWRLCDFLSPQPIDAWLGPRASWRSRL